MAELVGTLASVAQLVQLSGTLLAGGYGFLSKVARAPTEITSLLSECAGVNGLLGQLQNIADSGSDPDSTDALRALERLGVFRECETTLKSIQKALKTCEQMHGHDVRSFGRRLIWPFKEKETKDSLQRLHRLRELLANAMEANSASTLRRLEANQSLLMNDMKFLSNDAKMRMSDEEIRNVISWVFPKPADGAYDSFNSALERRLPGTGKWFLDSATFKDWCSCNNGTIWITGLPGSGKTLLCSSIIERTLKALSPTTALVFFYCDHRDRSKQTLENLLANFAKQLFDRSGACRERAKALYDEKGKSSGRSFISGDYLPLIEAMAYEFEEVTIVLDAVDEASEIDAIVEAMIRLQSTLTQRDISARILFSSRFDIRIEQKYAQISSNRVALADNMRPDIHLYVDLELKRRIEKGILKVKNKGLVPLIKEQIGQRAGTVLQARLQFECLSAMKNDRDMKSMLSSLPNGLDQTYETLLCHTASRYPLQISEIRRLLQCLTFAWSPLTATQLSELMAMRRGNDSLDFDAIATDPYDTLETVAPFVVIDRDQEAQGVVKLSHHSLEEYLRSEQLRQGPAAIFYVDVREANAWLASICLQYLTFSAFSSPLAKWEKPPAEYTFLRYAALNWFNHLVSAEHLPGLLEQCEPHLSHFFDDFNGSVYYQRSQAIYREARPGRGAGHLSPICFAIYVESDDLIDYLLPTIPSIDYQFTDGFTCLTAAALWAQRSVAEKLMSIGASVHVPTSRGLTPLHLAAEASRVGTVELLLDAGANPHASCDTGSTPFYRAARGGNVRILQLLKEHGSDINAGTDDGWTPLMEVVESGWEEGVNLLLAWGADPTRVNEDGEDAQDLAELCGQAAIREKMAIAMSVS